MLRVTGESPEARETTCSCTVSVSKHRVDTRIHEVYHVQLLVQDDSELLVVQDMSSTQAVKSSVSSSDALLCGVKLTYLEFVMSCIALAAEKVTKDESLVAKVCMQKPMFPRCMANQAS